MWTNLKNVMQVQFQPIIVNCTNAIQSARKAILNFLKYLKVHQVQKCTCGTLKCLTNKKKSIRKYLNTKK